MSFEISPSMRRLAVWLSSPLERLTLALRRIGGGSRSLSGDEADAALRAYQELVENANDIIYTHDLQGNFTSLNRAGELITGYTREEVTQMNLSQLVAPSHRDQVSQMIERSLAGETRGAHELEILSKNEDKRVLEVSIRPILRDGQPV
jgi:PAS domain S-box-containing protein